MSPSPRELLCHIHDECDYLIQHSASIDKSRFLDDETLKRAFVRSIEIIGEAVRKLPADTRDTQPDIDWRAIGDMRNRLIHEYFGVDYEIVWDVVTQRIAELRRAVADMLGGSGHNGH